MALITFNRVLPFVVVQAKRNAQSLKVRPCRAPSLPRISSGSGVNCSLGAMPSMQNNYGSNVK